MNADFSFPEVLVRISDAAAYLVFEGTGKHSLAGIATDTYFILQVFFAKA